MTNWVELILVVLFLYFVLTVLVGHIVKRFIPFTVLDEASDSLNQGLGAYTTYDHMKYLMEKGVNSVNNEIKFGSEGGCGAKVVPKNRFQYDARTAPMDPARDVIPLPFMKYRFR